MEKNCDLAAYIENPVAIDESGSKLYNNELLKLGQELKSIVGRDLVFCLCENTLGSLGGYIVFVQNGIVPLMLDATKDTGLLDNMIRIYKPRFLWTPKRFVSILPDYSVVYSYADYILLQTSELVCEILNENLAVLLTTSGSTGSPKLVRLSYNNIRSNAESIAEYLNITADERPVTSLPMYYSYGLSVINSHLLKGATILLTYKTVIQREFWTFVKEQKATSIAGVPYTYEMLKRLRVFRMDLPDLRTMTQAGGKLNADLAKEYMEQAATSGKKFVVMYGQTEATARMSYLPWEMALEKYDSIGIAIPGGKFSLIDKIGNEIIASGIDGELVYTGSNVSMGYAECREDLAKGDDNHGVLYTGDIARRDKEGYYYITGRVKRFIKIFGNRVNLDTVEQLVKVVTTTCACVGVDDKLTVFVTEKGREKEIKSLLVKKIGLNACAFTIQLIDTIPQNTSGKVKYAELTRLIEN